MNRLHQKSCVFVVPQMIFGKPVYDMNACIAFVSRNLTGNGFFVRCKPPNPNVLSISWDLKGPRPSPAHESMASAACAIYPDFVVPLDPITVGSDGNTLNASRCAPTDHACADASARPQHGTRRRAPVGNKKKCGKNNNNAVDDDSPLISSPCAKEFHLPLPTRDGLLSSPPKRAPQSQPFIDSHPTLFEKSISRFKPSGKFTLRV